MPSSVYKATVGELELPAGGKLGLSESSFSGARVCQEGRIVVGIGASIGGGDGDEVRSREAIADGRTEGCSVPKALYAVGAIVGAFEGRVEGCNVGAPGLTALGISVLEVGSAIGAAGCTVAESVGNGVGHSDGYAEGIKEGCNELKLSGEDGAMVGSGDGRADGHCVGIAVGRGDSASSVNDGIALATAGVFDGSAEGSRLGASVGCKVGALLGVFEGASVGVPVLGSNAHGMPVPKPHAVDG